jgi:hypothetical protein
MRTPLGENGAAAADVRKLLEGYPPEVRELTLRARELVRELAPAAAEEIDWSARMLGYTFIPGTYKGLILAISPQKRYVNVIFSTGVELLEEGLDDQGVLEGTDKKARHVKVRSAEILNDPTIRRLVEAAVERTPRRPG